MTTIVREKPSLEPRNICEPTAHRRHGKPTFDGKDVIGYTIEFWRWKAGVELSEEEARQAISDASEFFTLLNELDRAESDETAEDDTARPTRETAPDRKHIDGSTPRR